MGLASSKKNADGTFSPSTISLSDKKALSCKTFKPDEAHAGMYKGDQKILVVATSTNTLETDKGKLFWTGHNPTELFMPLAHLAHAGFTFEFASPEGKPVSIEAWAWPSIKACGHEEALRKVEADNKDGLNAPIKISEGLANLAAGKYIAVFWAGGHGSLNMKRDPSAEDFGKILVHAHTNKMPTISLCHGPDALRCAPAKTYEGYKICSFVDKEDDKAAKFGYLPGKLKEEDYPERNLIAEQGVTYVNKKGDDQCVVDRELITGSTNLAADNLGRAVVEELKKAISTEKKEEEKETQEEEKED